ncbi:hypothetical protein BJY52DRAFT_1228330 [Lactarius psammicola]|nr:hypothetical protein BJY52DRAFT_1228330 [Lactarius psammicola]
MCVDFALEPPILFDIIPKTELSLKLLRTLSLAANPHTPTSPTQSRVSVRVAAPPPSHLDASTDYRHSTKLRATLVWIGNTGDWSDSVFPLPVQSKASPNPASPSAVSNNDYTVRIFDVNVRGTKGAYSPPKRIHEVGTLRLDVPVEHSSISPDGRSHLSVGDLPQVHLRGMTGGPVRAATGTCTSTATAKRSSLEALLMATVGGWNGDLEQQRVSLFSSLAHLSQHGDIPVPQPYHPMLTKEWHVPLSPLPRDYYLRMPHDAVL